ncbi:MAG: glycosyltransferase [Candidatus Cloacimonetes bacterium]|nr:glycosyltransferase [Candidatus Cloacimonadota bacterium]
MRVVFVGPAWPLRGGIAQFIAIYAQRLEQAGHTVRVFGFHRQYPLLIFPGKGQIDHSEMRIPLDIHSLLTPYNPLTWPRTLQAIVHWKPDVVVFKYWIPFFAPAFGWLARRLRRRGIRSVYIIDNIDFHERWPLAAALTRYALSPATRLVTMSSSVHDSLRRLLPRFPEKRIHSLHHPNYDFYATGESDGAALRRELGVATDAPLPLFFGFIKPYKGLDVLLSALPGALRELPDLKLLVAGEVYGSDSVYRELIERHSLPVIWHDRFIPNEQTAAYFAAADVVVLPYRTATQSGITQLAFSCGKPVIASCVGGLPEIIDEGRTGYLVPPEDPDALAAAIVRFFREADDMVPAVRQANQRFGWEPFIELLEEML